MQIIYVISFFPYKVMYIMVEFLTEFTYIFIVICIYLPLSYAFVATNFQ